MQIRDTSDSVAYLELHDGYHHLMADQLRTELTRLQGLPSEEDFYRGITAGDALDIAAAEDQGRRPYSGYL